MSSSHATLGMFGRRSSTRGMESFPPPVYGGVILNKPAREARSGSGITGVEFVQMPMQPGGVGDFDFFRHFLQNASHQREQGEPL